jgi:hypothetical protein
MYISKHTLHNEFTAIIERDGKWYIGYCPELPGANGRVRPSMSVRTI